MSAPARTGGADLLVTEIIPITARDGMELNLHHVRGPRKATRGPVLVVHGAGVRANIFRPPEPVDFVRALVEDGFDVWLENWRASIDLPANPWDLDQAAVYDHPAAVEEVVARAGASTIKAVVHCQGSTSFVLAAVGGLLPQVDTIVSNAVSLHPVVPPMAHLKIRLAGPQVAKALHYLNPQWGLETPPGLLAKAIVAGVELVHHECDNPVCHLVSFTYGVGFPALWSHRNLSPATHHWLSHEFAAVPMRFFLQMGRSIARGHLVTAERFVELPDNPTAGPPRTDARFALFAGADNRCFLPASQERTFAFLDGYRPGYHTLHVVPGYGHLDMFMGRDAARDVFPLMLQELRR